MDAIERQKLQKVVITLEGYVEDLEAIAASTMKELPVTLAEPLQRSIDQIEQLISSTGE